MTQVLRVFTMLLSLMFTVTAFAKGGKATCDATPTSRLCSMAYFSPHPDPAVNAIYQVRVQEELDRWAAKNQDIMYAPSCNWVGVSAADLYLDCTFSTVQKKKCEMEMTVRKSRSHSSITCN